MMVFHIKQNDTSPSIQAALKNPKGGSVSLDGATVCFNMKTAKGETVVARAPVEVSNFQEGLVQYDWKVSDTQNPGLHYAEFEVTFSNGKVETFPNKDNIAVQINPDLG